MGKTVESGIPHIEKVELTAAQVAEFQSLEAQGRGQHYCAGLVAGKSHREVTPEELNNVKSYVFSQVNREKEIKVALPKGRVTTRMANEPVDELKIVCKPFADESAKAAYEQAKAARAPKAKTAGELAAEKKAAAEKLLAEAEAILSAAKTEGAE